MTAYRSIANIEKALERVLILGPCELHWLAIQLTGDRSISTEVAAQGSGMGPGANPFFENWMARWSRKVAIARALGAVTNEIAASALRTELRKFEYAAGLRYILPFAGRLHVRADRRELERALGAIDMFPRCAFLLTFFEKLPLEDVAVLLNSDKELVSSAKTIGMTELVRHMAGGPGAKVVRATGLRPAPEDSRGWLWGTN